jgi:hypothetical protein
MDNKTNSRIRSLEEKVAALEAQLVARSADDPDSWEANATYLLDNCPYTVWQRPGGGPVDLKSTLAVTFLGMKMRLAGDPMFKNR